jgi:branched-chain amino acid aminotransferase
MGLDMPSFDKLLEVTNQALTIHNFEEFRFRMYITPETTKNKTFYFFVEELIEDNQVFEDGIVINIARERKPFNPVIPYYVKSPLNGFIKYVHKKYDYYYESIILNEYGYVTECTFSNIFYVSGNVLITPHISSGVLPGITRDNVLSLANNLSMEVEEKQNVEIWELLSAEEVFLSHTSMGVVPVRRIFPDFTFAAPGLVTETLMDNWKEFILNDSTNWEGI